MTTATAKKIGGVLLVAVAAVGVWWALTPKPTDEERIIHALDDIAEAAETRHAGRIMAYVDPDGFHDGFHEGRELFQQILMYFMMTYKAVKVEWVERPTVTFEADGAQATAVLRADVFVGTHAGEKPTDPFVQRERRGNGYRVFFHKKDDRWLIYKVDAPPAS